MKTKVIFAILICAATTLSFSFSATQEKKEDLGNKSEVTSKTSEPIGGFVSEDRF